MNRINIVNKGFVVLLFAVMVLLAVVLPVKANSPVPGAGITIYLTEKPAVEVAFIDLLVPLSAESSNYCNYNSDNGRLYGIGENSDIVACQEEGFVSYTFHYAGAVSGMTIETVKIPEALPYEVDFENAMEDLKGKADDIKIAFLDSTGNMISVSEPVSIADTSIGYFVGSINIEPETMRIVDDGYYISAMTIIFLPFMMIPRVAVSVILETLIARLFKIIPLRKIVILNILTQLVLSLFMITTGLSYWTSLIIGEIMVYVIEAVIVLLLYKSIKREKLFIFVVTANTLSLGLGIWLNSIGVFKY